MRVTIVTSGNVSTNPRVVKEADALASAGHVVRVVAVDALPEHGERDVTVMRGRAWRLDRVNLRRGDLMGFAHRVTGAGVQWVAGQLYSEGVRWRWVVDRIVSRYLGLLTRAAAAEAADLVVGHNLAALPVAVRAAERLGARAGFDIEDLHRGELPETATRARAVVDQVERYYLPRCATVTASAGGIADAVAARYGIRRPYVALNTFPLEALPGRVERERPVAMYWYSQVIGAGRGIEDAIEAMAMLDGSVRLHLRGALDPGFGEWLRGRMAELGVTDRVTIWNPVPPGELVAKAAEYDIGLALEQPTVENRDLCVTNKLFTYMLAGLAVAATDTRGQREIMSAVGEAGFLYTPGRPQELADGVRRWLHDPGTLARARAASREAARSRYNWDVEAPWLVAYLERE
jgi:glycosyltransferase involved in cell wall biosynthesis